MGQAYKIDRLHLITYKGKKKKVMRSLRCRYMAKSQVVNCNAQSQTFDFVNFRGSHFKNTNFTNAVFNGCDFWGASFNNCKFQNVQIKDCVFVACRFKNCNFSNAAFSYTVIVNTNLSQCLNIDISSGTTLYSTYPKCTISEKLATVLESLKGDRNLKKNKLLFISDSKYNHLNLFLLQNKYHDKLPVLLSLLAETSTSTITTYKKLERVLHRLSQRAIM